MEYKIYLIGDRSLIATLHYWKYTWKLFIDDTFDNCVSYKKLAALIGGLTLINSRYEYRKLMFRSTLYAQPQTTDLLPSDLHHALFSVQGWLIVIRCLLKCILVFDLFHNARDQ